LPPLLSVVRVREADPERQLALQWRGGIAGLGFLDDFFYLRDFLLDFPGDFFDDAIVFQVRIVGELSHMALDRAFYVVKSAFG
jgi:hypothetical protein